jgi:hypothetical protein
MGELARSAPKLSWDDLAQIPALPLGSWLKTDPWDDKVHMLTAKRYAPMNARDKMPLEVAPLFFKLARYDTSKLALPPAPATNTPPAAAPADQQAAPPAAEATAGDASQPTTGTSNPPQQ